MQNLKMPGYYRCEVCGIDFARKNKLQRHRRRVHGAIVRCPHCSARVPKHRVDHLAKHLCMDRGGTSPEVAEETESSTTGARSLQLPPSSESGEGACCTLGPLSSATQRRRSSPRRSARFCQTGPSVCFRRPGPLTPPRQRGGARTPKLMSMNLRMK